MTPEKLIFTYKICLREHMSLFTLRYTIPASPSTRTVNHDNVQTFALLILNNYFNWFIRKYLFNHPSNLYLTPLQQFLSREVRVNLIDKIFNYCNLQTTYIESK